MLRYPNLLHVFLLSKLMTLCHMVAHPHPAQLPVSLPRSHPPCPPPSPCTTTSNSLRSCPAALAARQTYRPAWTSAARAMRSLQPCSDSRSPSPGATGCPSFSHVTVGAGLPLASHSKTVSLASMTETFLGALLLPRILGGTAGRGTGDGGEAGGKPLAVCKWV